MYFDVSVILLILLMTGYDMDSAPIEGVDYDLEWEELFGHLSKETAPRVTKPDKFFFGKNGPSKPPGRTTVPPAPPAPPFIFNPDSKQTIPSVGANSMGSMEGIAISQNRGIALGIYMVNSTYNSFNTVFGQSNNTQSFPQIPL